MSPLPTSRSEAEAVSESSINTGHSKNKLPETKPLKCWWIMAMKRKRVYAPYRRSIKRKGYRRKWRRGGKRTTTITSRQLSGTTGLFKYKKLTPRRKKQFQRTLWNASNIKQKFKADQSFTTHVVSSLISVNGSGMAVAEAFDRSNPFWTAGGGLRAVNFADPPVLPSLNPNTVFVRGGIIECTVGLNQNPSQELVDYDSQEMVIQLVYPKQQQRNYTNTNDVAPRVEWLSVTGGLWPRSRMSLLQDEADYDEYFYQPVLTKTMTLRPGDSISVQHKLRPKRVDADQWTRGFGASFPIWILYNRPNSSSESVAPTFDFTRSYRVAFTVEDL